MPEEQIKKALVETGKLTNENFEKASAISKDKKLSLEEVLIKEGFLTDEILGTALATLVNAPYVDLDHESIQDNYLDYLPEEVATAQEALIFDEDDNSFKLATTNPSNFKLIKDLEKIVGKKAEVYYATPTAI